MATEVAFEAPTSEQFDDSSHTAGIRRSKSAAEIAFKHGLAEALKASGSDVTVDPISEDDSASEASPTVLPTQKRATITRRVSATVRSNPCSPNSRRSSFMAQATPLATILSTIPLTHTGQGSANLVRRLRKNSVSSSSAPEECVAPNAAPTSAPTTPSGTRASFRSKMRPITPTMGLSPTNTLETMSGSSLTSTDSATVTESPKPVASYTTTETPRRRSSVVIPTVQDMQERKRSLASQATAPPATDLGGDFQEVALQGLGGRKEEKPEEKEYVLRRPTGAERLGVGVRRGIIVEVHPGSPAQQAQLPLQMKIVSVNGTRVEGEPNEQIVRRLITGGPVVKVLLVKPTDAEVGEIMLTKP
eukprot:comp21758_c0_seq1/m.30834 comp21758_c0_seq1/g.30834  ORF comp21758_c0_seq1/g.30834 comp21758_c0_seq1/m.30834 type:complete len:361 (-) comp21758_c0_seq1:339-1421(-)